MSKKCERCGEETSFFKGGAQLEDKYLCFDCYNRAVEQRQEKFVEREGRTFKCLYCGSDNIQKDIPVSSGERRIGLKYGNLVIPEIENFYADLCKDCGSVRTYVKESDRDWS